MKSNVLLILYVGLCFQLHCMEQNIDSLKQIIKQKSIPDKEKLDALSKLCSYQISNVPVKESMPYFHKMKEIAHSLRERKIETTASLYLTEAHMRLENFEKAKEYATEVLNLNEDYIAEYLLGINALGRVFHHFQEYQLAISTYNKGIIRSQKERYIKATVSNLYMNMGISYDRLGDDETEMRFYLKGLELADSINDIQAQNFASYTIASEYRDLGEYKKAEEYYLLGLNRSHHNLIEVYTSMNYHGLGILYSRWRKFEKAITYNQLALKAFRERGDELYEFDVLNNLAILYYRMDSINTSIDFGNQALILAQKLDHQLAIAGAKHTLGASYLKSGNLIKAEFYFHDILPQIDNTNVFDLTSKIDFLQNMANLREGQGRYTEALSFFKRFKEASDSLVERQRFNQVTKLENKYQSEKKEKELQKKESTILSQKLEIKKRSAKNSRLAFQRTRLTFILTFTFAALLILGIFFLRRGKLIKLERERTRQVVTKIDQLKSDLERKTKELKGDFSKKLTSFHEMLRGKYDISETIFEYWLLQVEGLSEEQMQERLHLSPAAIKSRRSKLYSALKSIEDIEQNTSLQRFRSVGIYYENMLKHFM